MIARLVTLSNALVRRLSDRFGLLRRLFQILTDYAWMSVYYFWEFDLKDADRPWRNVDLDSLRWKLATTEDCRSWIRNAVDGFSAADCNLLLSLIEKGDRVLVGYLPDSRRKELYGTSSPDDLPDCYAACATIIKPITKSCSFQMQDGEGTVRTVYTRRAARGLGLARSLYAQWAETTAKEGFQRLFIDIESSNLPSIRAVEKAGAHRIDSFVFYQIRFFKRSYILPFGSLRSRILPVDEDGKPSTR